MTKCVTDMRKNLTLNAISQFLSSHSEFCIQCNEINNFIQKTELHSEFEKLANNTDLSDEDDASLLTSEEELVFTIWDVRWWTKTSKRLDKIKALYEEVQTTSKPKTKPKSSVEITQYCCGCATLQEGKLSNIVVCSGSKKDIITFMNEQIQKRAIDSFLQSKPVFNLAYVEHDEEKLEEWLTIDELVEIGAITLS